MCGTSPTTEPAKDARPASGAPGARLLVVDDDALARATLARGLQMLGYRVEAAAEARTAVALCEAGPFDLALVDIRMPGVSGIELARELRERFGLAFIFLSAFSDPDTLREANDSGALGYLVKPLELSQIVPATETAIAWARGEREQREREGHLHTALTTSRETSIAVGILMAREGLDRTTAFELLRRRARDQRRKLHQVAVEVVQASEQLAFEKPSARARVQRPSGDDERSVK